MMLKRCRKVDRRDFLKSATAFGVSCAAFRSWCAAHGADFDFAGSAAACGWRETDEGAFYFLQASDLHMTENPDIERGALQMKDKIMGRSFIDEVNAMNALKAKPEMLLLTGDLTSGVSMNPSCWAFAERKWRHFRKYVTERLEVPCRQIVGNNDCARVPYEKVFPDHPVNWSFEKNGVLFVALHGYNRWNVENTNHAGILYDDEQLAWVEGLVGNSSAKTLVLVTHEPLICGDSHAARVQLAPVVDRFRGAEIWNIAGHEHRNHTATLRLGSRTVRSVETMTPVGSWKIGDGCYRVFFCKGGRLVGSALRWVTAAGEAIGYRPDPTTCDSPRACLVEESCPEALSVRLVGRDAFELGPKTVRIQNRISNYYVNASNSRTGAVSRLEFIVPREVGGVAVKSVVLLTDKGNEVRPLPPSGSDGRTSVVFENATRRGIKVFGYALVG